MLTSCKITFLLALVASLPSCGDVHEASGRGPQVDTVSPDSGSLVGGTSITITGADFDSGATPLVLVDGVPATDVEVTSDHEIIATTPPGERASVPVDVSVVVDRGRTVVPGGFTYLPGPLVFDVSPSLVDAGDTVTVRGLGFEADDIGSVHIFLGDEELEGVEVQSDTVLVATAPAPSDVPFEKLDLRVESGLGRSVLPDAVQIWQPGLLLWNGNRFFFIDPDATPVQLVLGPDVGGVDARAMSVDGSTLLMGEEGRYYRFNASDLSFIDVLQDPSSVGRAESIAVVGGTLYRFVTPQSSGRTKTAAASPLTSVDVDANFATTTVTSISVTGSTSIARRDDSSVWLLNRHGGGIGTTSLLAISLDDGTIVKDVALSGTGLIGQVTHGLTVYNGSVYALRFSDPDSVDGAEDRLAELVKIDPDSGVETVVWSAAARFRELIHHD